MSQIWKESSGGGGGGITTIDGNTGSVTGSTVTIETPTSNGDGSAKFSGSGTTLTLSFTDGHQNVAIGANTLSNPYSIISLRPTETVAIGSNAASSSSGEFGEGVLIGANCVPGATHSNNDVLIGSGYNGGGGLGYNYTSMSQNIILGCQAFVGSGTGQTSDQNIGIGYQVGNAFTGSESYNLLLGAGVGTAGDNNTIRIKDSTDQNPATSCYIGGIYGVTVGSPSMVTIDSSGQLGSAAIGGSGITTIDGNSGSATGSTVTINVASAQGSAAFAASSATSSLSFTDSHNATCLGTNAGNAGTNSARVTALGYNALNGQTSSNYNTAVGAYSIGAGTSAGTDNTCVGDSSGYLLDAGSCNAFFGSQCGNGITSGTYNVNVGCAAGYNCVTGTESNNVLLNSRGTNNESNALRIGAGTGTSTQELNKAFICGIQGISVTGTAVLVSSSDQLGIAVSSRRFKENIEDMGDASSSIYSLRPVKYNPKGDSSTFCTGLIAEEVNEVIPHIISYDRDGSPLTVRYHELPALLLNELQKLKAEVDALKKQVASCKT